MSDIKRKLTDTYELHNGVHIPCLGYGTWQTPNGQVAEEVVKEALGIGYRLIDCAACYGNEKSVGKGLKESGVSREEIFVTSKLWNTERGYEKTIAAFEKTREELQLEYLDLYLIHWPANALQFSNWKEINVDTWKAMIDLYKAGKVRAIGVSNFMPHHLESLMEMEIQPMVDQIEFHPGYMQPEAVEFCKNNGIVVEAWAPLGTGRMLQNPTLQEIAKRYDRSVAQICLRWCIQNQVLPLPKSVTPSRIQENSQVFDFEIKKEDMETINGMTGLGANLMHPDVVMF